MADANSVSPGLATLGAGGWTVTEPSAGGRFGSVGVLTPQQTLATQALVSGAGIPVSSYCQFCIPTLQSPGSGAAKDVSGNSRDLVLGSTAVDATVWGDTSRELNALATITDSASGSNYLYMPSFPVVWDLSEWFIFSMLLKCTVAPQVGNLISCANAGSAPGWYLKSDAAGKLYVVIINDAFAVGGNLASTPAITTQNRTNHITVGVDPVNKDIFLYVNGVLVNQWLNSWSGSGQSNLLLATANSGMPNGTTSMSKYGMLIGGIQYYKGAGAIPSHHAAIARRLAAQPFLPLSIMDV
ncbi:MAG: hypothetical protein AMXMBFR66_06480 [Pseudomonadota bacterium]